MTPTACRKKIAFLDRDKDPGAAFIVVPVALVAVMFAERVMLMMFVEPTRGVMIISHGATCTNGNEHGDQDRTDEIFLDGFHAVN
jgi:hypothetical protein